MPGSPFATTEFEVYGVDTVGVNDDEVFVALLIRGTEPARGMA